MPTYDRHLYLGRDAFRSNWAMRRSAFLPLSLSLSLSKSIFPLEGLGEGKGRIPSFLWQILGQNVGRGSSHVRKGGFHLGRPH